MSRSILIFKKFLYAWIEKNFMDGCSNYNTLTVRKSCRSKKQARDRFEQFNFPHARGEIFFNPLRAFEFVKKYGFPVVVKPNVSGYSRGSHFPITNYKELLKACIAVKIWWPSSVIEEYLLGENYRVVVIEGEIMSVIRRTPPFVVGDGVSDIGALIEQENATREQMQLLPTMHKLSPSKAQKYLRKSELTLQSVPKKEQTIYLHNKVALASGGVIFTEDKSTIGEKNKQLFQDILKAFDANILGIDIIMERGISEDYDTQKSICLEVNSRPYLKMHNYPRNGVKEDLSAYFEKLDRLEVNDGDIF